MERNVCGTDRLGRVVAGTALVVAGLAVRSRRPRSSTRRRLAGTLATLWGAEVLLTAAAQWCPLNAALGIDTCERDWPALLRDALGRGSRPSVADAEPTSAGRYSGPRPRRPDS